MSANEKAYLQIQPGNFGLVLPLRDLRRVSEIDPIYLFRPNFHDNTHSWQARKPRTSRGSLSQRNSAHLGCITPAVF